MRGDRTICQTAAVVNSRISGRWAAATGRSFGVTRPCPKSRLDELGTEPVAVATGCFQRDYPLATASGSVPGRLPTHILSYEAKPCHPVLFRRQPIEFRCIIVQHQARQLHRALSINLAVAHHSGQGQGERVARGVV